MLQCTAITNVKPSSFYISRKLQGVLKAHHKLFTCKITVSHFTLKHLIKSQPLRFDNHTKPYFGFVLINHAALAASFMKNG